MSRGVGRIKRGPIAADVIGRNFTQVFNAAARDKRLSRRARGLLVELLSHSDGYGVSVEGLVKLGPEGRDAIRSAIAELEKYGYLIRDRERDPVTGQLGEMVYLVTDMPDGLLLQADAPAADDTPEAPPETEVPCSDPASDFPTLAEPTQDNPTHKNTSNKNTSNTEEQDKTAPAARSAGDARRASAGSSACDARGGSAAAGKTSSSTKAQLTRAQAAAVSLIEDSLPEGLIEELRGKRLMGRHLPVSVRLAIVTALDGRTPEQLVDRVGRRWVRHGYAKKLRDGRRIASPLGVVHALVRAGECPDLGCEDGLMLDTGVDCRACEGRKDSHRRGERKTSSMPRQRQAAPSWTCTRCFTDSFTAPPETGQCPPCAAKTQADIDKLAALLQADAIQIDAPDACQADGAPWGDEEPPDPDEPGEEPYGDEQAAYTGTFDDITEEANR